LQQAAFAEGLGFVYSSLREQPSGIQRLRHVVSARLPL
jgi:hypothetical protein